MRRMPVLATLAVAIALAAAAACGGGGGGGGAIVRLAVIGDYGTAGPGAASVAALVRGWEPDAVLTTGDNNYPTGAADTIDRNVGAHYAAFIGDYRGRFGPGAGVNRFFPTLGNHDWMTAGAQPYLDYFTLPGNERYYDVGLGPVRVFALDSDPHEPDGVDAESAQARWLRDRLARATEPWRIVVFHHAPYGSSVHPPAEWMRWPFAAWGAHLVVAGHNHVYERVEVGGLPYLTVGLGGGARYALGPPAPGTAARWNAGWGALRIEASPHRLEAAFIAADGADVDRFTLGRADGALALLAP